MTTQISCVVPARNEGGHLQELMKKIMSLDEISDIVIIEGGSSDDTWEVAKSLATIDPSRVSAIQQTGRGKFNAVLDGAKLCQQNLVLIWDADGTVPVTNTLRIIETALSNNCAVIGNRLVGSMEIGAMRRANKIGNWIFAYLWAPILNGKPVDLLCGTKLVPKEVFLSIPESLLHADPYGDFALIANNLRLNYPLKSIPVDYTSRRYGVTNIHRWSGGLKLLWVTVIVYARRIQNV